MKKGTRVAFTCTSVGGACMRGTGRTVGDDDGGWVLVSCDPPLNEARRIVIECEVASLEVIS